MINKLSISLLLLMALALPSRGVTYYVDIVAGLDSNTATQAQSKSTPWAHAPGMLCATGAASSTTINPNDQIILKGGTGESWPNTCFMWSMASGSSGNPTYFGVDKTWFNGGSWTRPVLNAGGVLIPNNFGEMLNFANNITVDNFEITGYFAGIQPTGTYTVSGTAITCTANCTGTGAFTSALASRNLTIGIVGSSALACNATVSTFNSSTSLTLTANATAAGGSTGSCTTQSNASLSFKNLTSAPFNGAAGDWVIAFTGQSSGQLVENMLIDNWGHCGTNATTNCGTITAFLGGGSTGTTAHDNVAVNPAVSGDHSLQFAYSWGSTAFNNYMVTVGTGWNTAFSTSVHDNHIEDVGPFYCNMPTGSFAGNCNHENGFEDNGSNDILFYRNYITNVNFGLAVWLSPYPAFTATAWDNVVTLVHNGSNVIDLNQGVFLNSTLCPGGQTAQYCTDGGTFNFYNNTIENGDTTNSQVTTTCFTHALACTFKNNLFISSNAGQPCTGFVNCTQATNLAMTETTACTTNLLCPTQTPYPFAPTTSGNITQGAGTNLNSLATGSLITLAFDTSFACNLSGNFTACPARTPNALPSSGAYPVGAFLFASGNPSAGTPTCSPAGGTFSVTQNPTCSVTGGAPVICWRIGAVPSTNGTNGCGASSTLYTGPIAISSTSNLQLIAGGTGFTDGPVQSYTYTINPVTTAPAAATFALNVLPLPLAPLIPIISSVSPASTYRGPLGLLAGRQDLGYHAATDAQGQQYDGVLHMGQSTAQLHVQQSDTLLSDLIDGASTFAIRSYGDERNHVATRRYDARA